MTALCPNNGPSQPKPNVQNNIIYNGGALAAVLESAGYGWLASAVIVLGTLIYDATNLCESDPPAVQALTLAEIQALLTVQPSTDFTNGVGKLKNIVSTILWFQLCQCVSNPQPSAPAALTPPTGLQIQGSGAACWSQQSPLYAFPANAPNPYLIVMGPMQGQYVDTATGTQSLPRMIPVPQGATTVEVNFTVTDQQGPSQHYSYGGVFFYNSAFQLQEETPGPGNPTPIGTYTLTYTLLHPTTDVYFVPYMYPVFGGNSVTGSIQVTFFCNGQSPASIAGTCCPPDPTVVGLLLQIQDLVTFIQRQHVPSAYQNGAVHSGVNGQGEIAVSQLLGVKLTPTAMPVTFGSEAGDPDELWLDSWITWGNNDGWAPREWLRHSPQISLPANAQLYTKLGYSFAPGLSVDVQELEREA